MILVVGLGNPGLEYSKTRHNVGFLAIDMLAQKLNFESWKNKFSGHYTSGIVGKKKLILLKPQTFMNLSGPNVKSFVDYFKIETNNLFVIYDDIDLKLGTLKKKIGGGHAGHNGVKSIFESLQTSNFYMMRIGIGRPEQKEQVANYVLSKFSLNELPVIEDVLNKIAIDLEKIIISSVV